MGPQNPILAIKAPFVGCHRAMSLGGFAMLNVYGQGCGIANSGRCPCRVVQYPKGPCAQIAYTLGPMHLQREYFKAKVCALWVHGPLGVVLHGDVIAPMMKTGNIALHRIRNGSCGGLIDVAEDGYSSKGKRDFLRGLWCRAR